MEQPPVPLSATEEHPVPSIMKPGVTYVMKTPRNPEIPEWNVLSRQVNRKRTPLIRKMREMILAYDFGDHFDPREKSRIKEVTEALLAEAMGLETDDYEFIDGVEGVIVDELPEYYDLLVKDEEYAYDIRLLNLASLLYAVERKEGDKVFREVFPPKWLKQKWAYLRDEVDPKDVLALTQEGANLMRPTNDTVKNSEPPSTSDSDPNSSPAENGQP